GASGMLGAAVAELLVAGGHEVTTFQRRPSRIEGVHDCLGSLEAEPAVSEAVRGQDAIIHLAAKVSVSGPWQDYVRTNIEGTQRLLNAARAAGVASFVHVSSPSVAHRGAAISGAGAEPADPEAARGNYAR